MTSEASPALWRRICITIAFVIFVFNSLTSNVEIIQQNLRRIKSKDHLHGAYNQSGEDVLLHSRTDIKTTDMNNSLPTNIFNTTNRTSTLAGQTVTTYLTMYGDHRVKSSIAALPKWLQEYVAWNQNERATKDVKDIRFFVVKCIKNEDCGGISDRLRVLPFYIFMAARTNRVLCIYWEKPMRLESFLQVPKGGLDWTCPAEFEGKNSLGMSSRIPKESKPRFFSILNQIIDEMNASSMQYVTLFAIRSISRVNFMNNIFNAHSYQHQMPVASKWFHLDLMEHIFRVMFKPVPSIAKNVNATMARLNLVEGRYTSVHMRARYPTKHIEQIVGTEHIKGYDEGSYVEAFDGKYMSYILDLTSNALECGLSLDKKKNPIFFISDSNDLVNHVITNEIPLNNNNNTNVQAVGVGQRSIIKHIDVFNSSSSEASMEESYYPLFEDLLIMGGSKCVAHGVGSYGAFGAGLAGNRCSALHRRFTGIPLKCPNNDTVPMYVDIANNSWSLAQNESISIE